MKPTLFLFATLASLIIAIPIQIHPQPNSHQNSAPALLAARNPQDDKNTVATAEVTTTEDDKEKKEKEEKEEKEKTNNGNSPNSDLTGPEVAEKAKDKEYKHVIPDLTSTVDCTAEIEKCPASLPKEALCHCRNAKRRGCFIKENKPNGKPEKLEKC